MSSSKHLPSHGPATATARIFAWILVLILAALSPSAARAQQAKPASPPTGITPKAVAEGSAKFVAPLEAGQKLRLAIALHPPKLAEEEKFVEDLRTKGSPSFGKFLTPEQWNKRFAPSVEDEQAVVDWAASQGLTVTNRYANRLIVDVEAPAATIEKALNVTFGKYEVDGKTLFSADRDPVIPASLIGKIQNIQGLNNINHLSPMNKSAVVPDFAVYSAGPVAAKGEAGGLNSSAPKPKSLRKDGVSPNITDFAYDPTDIYSSQAYDVQALYNQGHCCNPFGNPGTTPKETSIAIASAGTQQTSDFLGFHNQYPYLAMHWYFTYIDGTPACCDGEGTMDFEWSTAMSNSFGSLADTASVHMYDGVNANFNTFEDIYNTILSDNSTRVMSVSWGCAESACYDNTDMDTTHNIFLNMVGEGWTLVAASGDHGATPSCTDAYGVMYPSSDPNVVGAGGTTLSLDGNSNFISHTAWSGGPEGCALGNPRVNDGGSTGGVSSYYGVPGFQNGLGYGGRAVPDLALNADWYYTPQNLYFGGGLGGNGGTSIVAPELAGMFANMNAYLLTLGNNCANEGGPCAPMGGLVNSMVYYLGANPGYAAHYPFYDITSGCNNNDVTAFYGLGSWCAGTGYDPVTGWGSFNALQLAWGFNTYRAGDFGAPVVTFSGPSTSVWYNNDQEVSWSIADTSGLSGYAANGVSGFTQGWDSIPTDAQSEATPGSGNSFYSGPEYPNGTSGCLETAGGNGCQAGVSQGCHYAHVQAWDNSGFSSGDVAYGPICYDTVSPVTTASLAGTLVGSNYESAVRVTLSATDATSGVASTKYSIDGGPFAAYVGPFTISHTGGQTVQFYSVDHANNAGATQTVSFHIVSPTKTTQASSANPSTYGQSITFTAKVTPSVAGAPTGTVAFKLGTGTLATVALNSSGVATFSTGSLAVGTHSLTAVYSGSATDLASTSPALSQVVAAAATTTTLASSLNPSTSGKSVTFTAKVTPASGAVPTGTVAFKLGTGTIATVALNSSGVATFSTGSLAVGTHSLTAVYSGSATDLASTSPALSQVVAAAATTTTLASSLNPSTSGKSVTFTAKVTPASGAVPTGTVAFKLGTGTIATVALNSSGVASFSTGSLAVGTHSLTAVYSGSATDLASTSPALSQVVNAATTTTTLASSLNPSTSGKSVTFTAKVTPASGAVPTGTVAFKLGTGTLATVALNSSGVATFSTGSLSVGTHSLTAVYSGSATDLASTSPALSQVVNK